MFRTVLVTGTGRSELLLEDRDAGYAYVCHAGVCELPVSSVTALETELQRSGAWPS